MGCMHVFFMKDVRETNIRENIIDVLFPEATTFRMSSEGAKCMDDLMRRCGWVCVESGFAPIIEDLINFEKGRDLRSGRMGTCVMCITCSSC
jgi:hypothetical protein